MGAAWPPVLGTYSLKTCWAVSSTKVYCIKIMMATKSDSTFSGYTKRMRLGFEPWCGWWDFSEGLPKSTCGLSCSGCSKKSLCGSSVPLTWLKYSPIFQFGNRRAFSLRPSKQCICLDFDVPVLCSLHLIFQLPFEADLAQGLSHIHCHFLSW